LTSVKFKPASAALSTHTQEKTDMNYIEYNTGRTYDTEQVLAITIEEQGTDEWGFGEITATFYDASRGILGRVVRLPFFSSDNIGEIILSAYDQGKYTPV
jgi:hypothetical protein